jgi:hypothetical protein
MVLSTGDAEVEIGWTQFRQAWDQFEITSGPISAGRWPIEIASETISVGF